MTDPNLVIELDHNGFFCPGQIITGRVVRVVVGPQEQIRYFPLKFQGYGRTWWETHQTHHGANGETWTTTETHRNHATYFEHSFPLDRHPDGSWIKSIPHGRNSFPFAFVLPVGIPASFSHNAFEEESKIYYQVKATYSTQTGPEVTTLLDIQVERPVDLNIFPLAAKSNTVEGEKFLCYCCCESGPISFKLAFNKTGFVVGERIEFLADLVNDSSTDIEAVQVWLSRTVYFRATDNTRYFILSQRPIGPVCLLPAPSAGERIEVPASFNMIRAFYQPINDFGCNFMQASHQLHIKVVIPGAFNLSGIIPIVIGNVPFVIPTSSHSTFQSQSQNLAVSPSPVQ